MRTDAVIKQEGMGALVAALGYTDAKRFIALTANDSFDYTEWRREHLPEAESVRALSEDAMRYSSKTT